MKSYNIEKRLPFGFRGLWGRVYKPYDYDAEDVESVVYKKRNYVDIGLEVQFVKSEDRYNREKINIEHMKDSSNTVFKTTDSYWNGYEDICIVDIDDFIKINNLWYQVVEIKAQSIFTPAEHKFFYCTVNNIRWEDINVKK